MKIEAKWSVSRHMHRSRAQILFSTTQLSFTIDDDDDDRQHDTTSNDALLLAHLDTVATLYRLELTKVAVLFYSYSE